MSNDMAILDGDIIIKKIREGDEIELTYIHGFKELTPIININSDIKSVLKIFSGNLIEKCPLQSSENCSKCFYNTNLDNEKNCLLKLFSCFTGKAPRPHHGQEYYDVEIEIITIPGTKLAGGVFLKKISENLTNCNDKNLKTQIIDVLVDDTIEIVGVLAKSNYKLKTMIRSLCRKYKKQLFFIEEEDIIRMLYDRADKDGSYNINILSQIANTIVRSK